MGTPDARVEVGTLEHLERFELRPECVREAEALGCSDTFEALLDSYDSSAICLAGVFDGEVAFMCGAGPSDEEGVGIGWFLTSKAAAAHPRAFLRTSRQAFGLLLTHYPVLLNRIDSRCPDTLRWVKWLGCEVGEPTPVGPQGVLFHPVMLRRSDVLLHP